MFKRFIARVLVFLQLYSALFQGVAHGYGILETYAVRDEIYLHGSVCEDGRLRLALGTNAVGGKETDFLGLIEVPSYQTLKSQKTKILIEPALQSSSLASSHSQHLQATDRAEDSRDNALDEVCDDGVSSVAVTSFGSMDLEKSFINERAVSPTFSEQSQVSDDEDTGVFTSSEGITRDRDGIHFDLQGLKIFMNNDGELLVQGNQTDFTKPIFLSTKRSVILHDVFASALKLTAPSIVNVGESNIDFLSLEGLLGDDGIFNDETLAPFINQGSLTIKEMFLKNLTTANNGTIETDNLEIQEGHFENTGTLSANTQILLGAHQFINRGTTSAPSIQGLETLKEIRNAAGGIIALDEGFTSGEQTTVINHGTLKAEYYDIFGPSFIQQGKLTGKGLKVGQHTSVRTSASQELTLDESIDSASQLPWVLEGIINTPAFRHEGILDLAGQLTTNLFEGHGVIREGAILKAKQTHFTQSTANLGKVITRHLDADQGLSIDGAMTVRDQATIVGYFQVGEKGRVEGMEDKTLTLTLQEGGEIAGFVDADHLSAAKPLTLMSKGKLVSRQSTHLQADLTIHPEASAELHHLSSINGILENQGTFEIHGVRSGSRLHLINSGVVHVDAEKPTANTASFAVPNPHYDAEFLGLDPTRAKLRATYYKSLLLPIVGRIDPEISEMNPTQAKIKGFEYKQQFLELARGTSLGQLEADQQELRRRLFLTEDAEQDFSLQKFGTITPVEFLPFETWSSSQLLSQLKTNAADYGLALPAKIEERSSPYLVNLARHQQRAIHQLQLVLPRELTTLLLTHTAAKRAAFALSEKLGIDTQEQQKLISKLTFTGAIRKVAELRAEYIKKYHLELVQQAWAQTSSDSFDQALIDAELDKILDIESPNVKNPAQLRAAGIGYYRKAGLLTPEKFAEFNEKNPAKMRTAAIHAANAYREKALRDNPYLLQQARDNALIAADEKVMQPEIEKLFPMDLQRKNARRSSHSDAIDLAKKLSNQLGTLSQEEKKTLFKMAHHEAIQKVEEFQNQLKPKYIADHPEIIAQAREATRTAVQYLKRLEQQMAAYKSMAAEIFKVNLQAVNHSTGQLTLKSGRFDFTDAGALVNEGTLVQEQAAVHWLAKASEGFNTGTWRVKGSLELDGYRSENPGNLEVESILKVTTPDDAMEAFKGLAKVKAQRLVMHAPRLKDVTPEDKILPWVLELHLAQDFETNAKMTTGPLELFCKSFKPGGKLFAHQLDVVSELADLNIDSIVFGRGYIRLATDRLSINGRVVLPGKACPNILYTRSGSGFHSEGPVMLDVKEHWHNYYGTISGSSYQITGPSLTNTAGYIEGNDETQKSFLRMARIEHTRDAQGSYGEPYCPGHQTARRARNQTEANKRWCTPKCSSLPRACETSDEAVIYHKGDLELTYDSLDVMVSQIASAKTLTLIAQGQVKAIGEAFDAHIGTTVAAERNGKRPLIRSRHFQGNLGDAVLAGTLKAEDVGIEAANLTLQHLQLSDSQQGTVVRIVQQLMRPGHSKLYELTDAGYDTVIPWSQKELPHSIALVGCDAEHLPETFGMQCSYRALEYIMGPLFHDLYRGVSYLGISLDDLLKHAVDYVRVQKGTTTRTYLIKDGDTTREIEVVSNPEITPEDLKKSGIPMVLMEFVKNLNRVEDDLKATQFAAQLRKVAAEACLVIPKETETRSGIFAEKGPLDITITEGDLNNLGTTISGYGRTDVLKGGIRHLSQTVRQGDHENYVKIVNRAGLENLKENETLSESCAKDIEVQGALFNAAGKGSRIERKTPGVYRDIALPVSSQRTTYSETKKTSSVTVVNQTHMDTTSYEGEGSHKLEIGSGVSMEAPKVKASLTVYSPTFTIAQVHDYYSSQTTTTKKGKKSWYGASGARKTVRQASQSFFSRGGKIQGPGFLAQVKYFSAVNTLFDSPDAQIDAEEKAEFLVGTSQSFSQTVTDYQGAMWNKQSVERESHVVQQPCVYKQPVMVDAPSIIADRRADATENEPNLRGSVPVTYRTVYDQHDHQKHSQRSLSSGAALITKLAVALVLYSNPVTFGMGGTSGVMVNAGFGTLCSDAAVSLIEHDGNPGRALQAMGRNGTVLNVVKSMATAGITKELGDALGIKTAPVFENGKLVERAFTDYAKTAVLQSAVSTAMTMVVDGVDPGEALKQGAVSAVINTAAAWGAGKIGGMYRVKAVDPVVHKALHASLAAASNATAAAILGNDVSMAALSGATGAFLAETLADVLKPDEKAELKSAMQNKMKPEEFEEAFMAKAQASTQWANFVATIAAFGLGQDAGIAYGAAYTATANNNLTTARTIARAASQTLSLSYRAAYAAFAAGGLKGLLDHLQIKNNRDGTYTYDGVKYGELTEVIDIIKASPVFLDAVAAIEILSNFMDASPDAGKPTSLTTPIHEGKPITLVTPIADQHEFSEGFDQASEEFSRGLVEGFDAYDGLRITSFTKDNVIIDRELYPKDLGVKGQLEELTGRFVVNDKTATVRIDMIKGKMDNTMEVINNLSKLARSNGANVLKIEGTIANTDLLNVLSQRYKANMVSKGANEIITIQLK